MENESRLRRKDNSKLVENVAWGLNVLFLFPYKVPTMFSTLVLIHFWSLFRLIINDWKIILILLFKITKLHLLDLLSYMILYEHTPIVY